MSALGKRRQERRALNALVESQRGFLYPGRWSRLRHPRWVLRRRLRGAVKSGHITFGRPGGDDL